MSTPTISGRESLKICIPPSKKFPIPIPKPPSKETRVFHERVLTDAPSQQYKKRSWETINLTSPPSLHYESFPFHVGTASYREKRSLNASSVRDERRREKVPERELSPAEPRLSTSTTVVDRSSLRSPIQKENIRPTASRSRAQSEDDLATMPQSKEPFSENWKDELQFPFEDPEFNTHEQ